MQEAALRFGDGETLPFTPCKKGYQPFTTGTNKAMYACPLHDKERRRRVKKEGFRKGEVDLKELFWSQKEDPSEGATKKKTTEIEEKDPENNPQFSNLETTKPKAKSQKKEGAATCSDS